MPTKKSETIGAPAPAASAPSTVVVEEAPSHRLPALAIAGITLGGVVLAGLLFGGGLLVGTHLQAGGEFGTHQRFDGNNFPGGPNGFGGSGPGHHRQPGLNGGNGQGGQPGGGNQGGNGS